MKVLRIKLRQNQASYTREETRDNRMTYPLPPYSTLVGALHSACGYTEYHPMDLSIQGKYDSMQREIYVNHGLLNNKHDDRNILIYLSNPELLTAGFITVGEGLKGQGNSFLRRKTVRIENEKLYQKYVHLEDLKKEFEVEKKEVVKPMIDRLKGEERELKAKQNDLDKKSEEYIKLKSEIEELKAEYKRVDRDYKETFIREYEKPSSHFRTLVKAPQFQEVLYDVELAIHIRSDDGTIQDIKNNINNLVCIGRSEDFVELIEIKEVELREPYKDVNLKNNYKMYVNLDRIMTEDDDSKSFLIYDGQNKKEAKGTVYYLNKEYEIIENKRIFNKIPCLYSSLFMLDDQSEAYIDADEYLTDFN